MCAIPQFDSSSGREAPIKVNFPHTVYVKLYPLAGALRATEFFYL